MLGTLICLGESFLKFISHFLILAICLQHDVFIMLQDHTYTRAFILYV